MRVVLLEPAHPGEPSERAGQLVTVQHAEVRHPQRQLAVGAGLLVKHDAVARAVHGLQPERFLLNVKPETRFVYSVQSKETDLIYLNMQSA